MKECETHRQEMLDLGWKSSDLTQMRRIMAHLDGCADCQAALADYERIRRLLAADDQAGVDAAWASRGRREEGRGKRAEGRRTAVGTGMRIAATALAACLLLATGYAGHGLWPPRRPAPIAQQNTVAGHGVFPADEAEQDARAFDRIADVFERRTTWMVLGDDSNIGLSNQPLEPGQAVLVLRLSLCRSGITLSTADLAIVAGQSVRLNLPLPGGDRLAYGLGTSATQPASFALAVQLHKGDESLGELKTKFRVDSGHSVTAGTIATVSGDYEIHVASGRTGAAATTKTRM